MIGAAKYRRMMADLDCKGQVCSIKRIQNKHYEVYINFEIVKKIKKRESANKYIARLHKSKTMSKYFTHKQNCNQSQNQSQKAATELLDTMSNRIVTDVPKFMEKLKQDVAAINISYPRCRDIAVSKWDSSANAMGVSLSCGNWNANIYLYKIIED